MQRCFSFNLEPVRALREQAEKQAQEVLLDASDLPQTTSTSIERS